MKSPIISASDLNDLKNSKSKLVIFDCRFNLADKSEGEKLYREIHIQGACYADLEKNMSGVLGPGIGRHPMPDIQKFVGYLRSCDVDNDTTVICYDAHNATYAARMWWLLKFVGLPDARVLDGGFKAWQDKGYPCDNREPAKASGHFVEKVNSSMLQNAQKVLQNISKKEFILVDARDPQRFSGATEPIDKKAGHVPGAVNHPFAKNMTSDGRFKSKQELREMLSGFGPEKEACMMCGSGVTACNNILAMEIAGYKTPKLFAGSWSEWIENENHPIATD